jgi:hypothetical protein
VKKPTKKQLEEIEVTKKMIKFVEKGFGKDKCKGYAPNCPNCQGQILLGHLYDYLDLLEYE